MVAERARVLVLEEALAILNARGLDWDAAAANLASLHARVNTQESRVVGPSHEVGGQSRVRLIENEATGPFVEINSIEVACQVIANNLQASGVVKREPTATRGIFWRQSSAANLFSSKVQPRI